MSKEPYFDTTSQNIRKSLCTASDAVIHVLVSDRAHVVVPAMVDKSLEKLATEKKHLSCYPPMARNMNSGPDLGLKKRMNE